MPAAAVIPAPIAYIKVVAVKKLVVEFQTRLFGAGLWFAPGTRQAHLRGARQPSLISGHSGACSLLGARPDQKDYLEKNRVFKAGNDCLNTLAWNNKIGRWFYFVGF